LQPISCQRGWARQVLAGSPRFDGRNLGRCGPQYLSHRDGVHTTALDPHLILFASRERPRKAAKTWRNGCSRSSSSRRNCAPSCLVLDHAGTQRADGLLAHLGLEVEVRRPLDPRPGCFRLRYRAELRPVHAATPIGPGWREAPSLCAQHVRSLGSESLLSNLMEVKD
jgi:hypothetical protein